MMYSKMEAELKTLASDAKSNLYRRLELAAGLSKDSHWLAMHDGSLDKAEKYLADNYFADIRGLIQFSKLLAMYEKFPRETWDEYRFDLAAIESLYDDSNAKSQGSSRPSYKTQVTELSDSIRDLNAKMVTERKRRDSIETQLRQRLEELELENRELRDEIRNLRQQLEERSVAIG